jgi:hypothetical protein
MAYAISFKVEYLTEVFDLRTPRRAFALLFQLYNFLSEAEADNEDLHEPENRLLFVTGKDFGGPKTISNSYIKEKTRRGRNNYPSLSQSIRWWGGTR